MRFLAVALTKVGAAAFSVLNCCVRELFRIWDISAVLVMENQESKIFIAEYVDESLQSMNANIYGQNEQKFDEFAVHLKMILV